MHGPYNVKFVLGCIIIYILLIIVFLRPTDIYLLTPNDPSVIAVKPKNKYRIRMAIKFYILKNLNNRWVVENKPG